MTRTRLSGSDSKQCHETRRPHDDELERVPNQDESDGKEPPGRAAVDQRGEKRSSIKARDRDQHRRDAPLEAVARAERIERDVGRHVPTHEGTQVDADSPDQSKHGDSPLRVCGDKDEEHRPAERLATASGGGSSKIEIAYCKPTRPSYSAEGALATGSITHGYRPGGVAFAQITGLHR